MGLLRLQNPAQVERGVTERLPEVVLLALEVGAVGLTPLHLTHVTVGLVVVLLLLVVVMAVLRLQVQAVDPIMPVQELTVQATSQVEVELELGLETTSVSNNQVMPEMEVAMEVAAVAVARVPEVLQVVKERVNPELLFWNGSKERQ